MKTCKSCQNSLPLDQFYAEKRYKGGHRPLCKPCYLTARKAAREAMTAEQRNELKQRWRNSARESYQRRKEKRPES